MTATRRDLARALKEQYGGSISGHDEWIKAFIDVLATSISEKGRVELRGFGAFSLSTIKAHTTVDPSVEVAEGEKRKRKKVPMSYSVDFRPSKLYKERLKKDQARKRRKKRRRSKKKEKS